MIKQFGYTWWGQHWLNAFNDIDFSNRLPRGKSYARNGKAYDIIIVGNTVNAKVQGSRPRPYKVTVAVTAFTNAEKETIFHCITDNPVFLSQLISRELPSKINEVLSRQGIHLFPFSWSDMDARCDCPDDAMPCKHIAAVIYLIANEIDKNPFLIFELHGMDLPKVLREKGFTDARPAMDEIPTVHQLTQQLLAEPPQPLPKAAVLPDLSTIPECRDELLSLLTPNPLFYPEGDFREIYAKALKSGAREAKKLLEITVRSAEKSASNLLPPEAVAHIEVQFSDQLAITQLRFLNTNGQAQENPRQHSHPMEFLAEWLKALNPERLSRYAPTVQAFSLLYRCSLVLLRQGALVPRIFGTGSQNYTIFWFPALLNNAVRQVIEQIATQIPPGTLSVYTDGRSHYFPPQEQAVYLIGAFLTDLMSQHPYDYEAAGRVFFGSDHLKAHSFETREYPITIYLWLRRFFLAEKNVVPVIRIREQELIAPDAGFAIELLVRQKKGSYEEPVPLQEVFRQETFRELRHAVLQDIALLINYFPRLSTIIASQGEKTLYVDGASFAGIFLQTLPVIRLLGIDVLLPKSLQKLMRPALSMMMDADEKGITKHFLNIDQMLTYKWQIAIGETQLSAEEFLQLVKGMSGIVRIRDQYVYLNPEEIKKLVDQLENPPELSGQSLLQTALMEEYEGAGIHLSRQAQKLLLDLLDTEAVKLPRHLQATLRPYQVRGYAWLYKNSRIGFGSIIADDMGLGKTLQVIATLLKFKEEGYLDKKKALVVVPTTLLTNWQKEIDRFAPKLRWHTYHGPKRAFPENDFDIMLTTYGIARSDDKALSKLKWHTLVIDEAQNIKNPGTAQTKAIKKLKADIRMAMSGTPVENRLSEYWSIMDFTNKGYLGGLKPFLRDFSYPIEVEQDQHKLNNFRKIVSPFIMRRVKTDKSIISDLPEKISTDEYCTLTNEQAAIYQNVVNEIMKQIETLEGIERRGLVFKLIIALKQVCNHPVQYLKRGDKNFTLSGKAQRLIGLLDEMYEQREKVLIFTQFREMGDLLRQFISQVYHTQPLFLHGGCSRKQRDEMVENFQHQPEINTMILSLKAGGTGLNLTQANHVIHYDLWWNPAVEAQATDRAYRIGQQKNVFVYRLITQGTFEEKINQMIMEKRELADLAVSQGEQWIGELSDKDLKSLFTLS